MFLNSLVAQTSSNETTQEVALSGQFDALIEESETFQQFKVIPRTGLNKFRRALADSLKRYRNNIATIENERNLVEERNDSLQKQVEEVNIALAATQEKVDNMNFFGMMVTKSAYNLIMWGIVIALIALLVFLYLAFLNANRVARQSKNDKVRLDNELEDLRKSANEKQVKIKRELQTALNKLEDRNKQ